LGGGELLLGLELLLELLSGCLSGWLRCEGLGVAVRVVEGVDEGVDPGAVGTRRYSTLAVGSGVASEASSVDVEPEVPVGGVMGVDEGVGVGGGGKVLLRLGDKVLCLCGDECVLAGVDVLVVVVVIADGLDSGLGELLGLRGSSYSAGSWGGHIGSRVLSVSSGRNMVSLQYLESILTRSVPDSDSFTSLVYVTILSHSLPISRGLLPVHCTILLGIGSSKPSVSSIESLLLQYFGLLRVDILREGGSSQTGGDNKFEHVD